MFFYIRLVYYDLNTPGLCIMIIVQQPGVTIHQQQQADVKPLNTEIQVLFIYLTYLHQPAVAGVFLHQAVVL